MRRRKLLISIGALGAGGTAAFGTEAFTSVEAERSVDVTVAGDESAFLAIQPLSGDNAEDYVSEDGSTVALNFDGDNSGPGKGVNQDAITQVEDLFRVVNQGTQPSSVYFEEDSSAVTFRVTKSADTETTGSSGQSLEGTSNSVELDVGEQVVVGITIDTLENDVSGSLIDSVTIHAEAGAAAPEQNIAQPQYVVDPAADTGASDAGNVFQTVQSAVDAADAGAVIGIKNTGQETLNPSNSIEITTNDLTLGGFEGVPTINDSGTTVDNDAIVELGDGVSGITITDIAIDYGSDHAISQVGGGDNNQVDNVTIDGTVLTSTDTGTESNAIDISGANISLTNNDVTGGGIQIQHDGTSDSDLQVVGNDVSGDDNDGVLDEGIVVFNSVDGDLSDDNLSIDITDNRVRDTGGDSDLKLESSPAGVNGASDRQSQIKSILNENDLGSIEVPAGTVSTTVSPQFNQFDNLQSAIDETDSGGVTAVQSGSYQESVTIETNDITLTPADGTAPRVIGKETNAVTIDANRVTVSGLEIRNPTGAGDGNTDVNAVGVKIDPASTGVTVRNNTVTEVGTEANTNVIGIYAERDSDNLTISANTISNLNGTADDKARTQAILLIAQESSSVGSITDVTIADNTITKVFDTRSVKGIELNGDISGDITNNELSGLDTDGPVDTGFTQAIALGKGDNANNGPSDVEIKANSISSLETAEPDDAFPPTHIILSAVNDVTTVTIKNNNFTAVAADENYILDRATGDFGLDNAQENNTFTPVSTQISEGDEDDDRVLRPQS